MIGLGEMGTGAYYGKTDESQALETLTHAADRGVTFWDTLDIYAQSSVLSSLPSIQFINSPNDNRPPAAEATLVRLHGAPIGNIPRHQVRGDGPLAER